MIKKLSQSQWVKEKTGRWLLSQKHKPLFFFYLLLFFLPTQFGRHFWPPYASFYGFRIDYLSPTLYATDIIIVLLFSSWLLPKFSIFNFQFSIKSRFLNIKNLFQISNFKFQVILLPAFLLANILFSKAPLAGLYGLAKVCEYAFLGIFIARNGKIISKRICCLILGVSVFFESGIGLLQFFLHHSLGGLFYFFGERTFTSVTPGIANANINGMLVLRPYGTFPHPNVFAGFLVLTLLFLLLEPAKKKSMGETLLRVGTLLLGTTMLFLTLSRVTILLWIIVLGIKGVRSIKKHQSTSAYTVSILLGIFFCALFFLTPFLTRLMTTHLGEESVVRRQVLSQDAVTLVLHHPVFGVGVGNFLINLPTVEKLQSFSSLQPVHNIFLLVLAELGVPGFLIFLFFLLKTVKKTMEQKHFLFSFPFISLVVFFVLGLTDHYFFTLEQGQLLTVLIFGFAWAKKR